MRLLLGALAMMGALWVLSLVRRDASLVDRFWGLGFLFLYGWQLRDARFLTFRAALVLGLVALWAVRLSVYIHLRNRKAGEDARYRKMRDAHGSSFWWVSLFTVFFLQGTLMWVISFPLMVVLLFPQSDRATLMDYLGLTLWTIGFLFEAVADFQMARFKRNPANRGRVCRVGLWNLSRHPNYFGEAILWWGFWIVAANTTVGLYTIFSPVLMTYLLLRVSGVALLEKQLRQTKPEYARYAEEVPPFFPGRLLSRTRNHKA